MITHAFAVFFWGRVVFFQRKPVGIGHPFCAVAPQKSFRAVCAMALSEESKCFDVALSRCSSQSAQALVSRRCKHAEVVTTARHSNRIQEWEPVMTDRRITIPEAGSSEMTGRPDRTPIFRRRRSSTHLMEARELLRQIHKRFSRGQQLATRELTRRVWSNRRSVRFCRKIGCARVSVGRQAAAKICSSSPCTPIIK